MSDRAEMSEKLAEALLDVGVPAIRVHKAVQAVMTTLASTAIEDAIASMVDKRMNTLQSRIDGLVEMRLEAAIKKTFTHSLMRELVSKEAAKQAGNIYNFMFEHKGAGKE